MTWSALERRLTFGVPLLVLAPLTFASMGNSVNRLCLLLSVLCNLVREENCRQALLVQKFLTGPAPLFPVNLVLVTGVQFVVMMMMKGANGLNLVMAIAGSSIELYYF